MNRARSLPLATGAVLLAGALVLPASATPAPVAAAGTRITVAPTTVTLLTGDKVTLTPDPSGGEPAMSVAAATRSDGSTPIVRIRQQKDRSLVVPDDAMPYLASGVLDPTLFDVSYLAANGYADAADSTLPLITQMASSLPMAKVRGSADALPGVTPTHDLTSLHGTATKLPKTQASAFWAAIGARPAAGRRAALSRSVAKVWLDRKVQATLDRSVPMIGAPQAWAAGYTGKGVKVAILDTGIDETHPDLQGKVSVSKNFTGDPSVADGFGHGTHVASIITGTGAASGGKYKGVAPDVSLLIGKVLDHTGFGDESDVIAGMEWAAAQGARVVNLSLGGPAPVDEAQDPGALAVDKLSASTNTLFVVAAGNSGGKSTIGSPGVAEAALTVASVDKADHLASYSSRGPLPYNDRVDKPDIAGPGSDIVAARAAGTTMGSPVDDYYTTASGTSMATPHVAGAAAILAQEHPDWTGPELKAALMASSKDDGYNAFEQGAGRVDLVRATSQQVTSTTTNLDFAKVVNNQTEAVKKQVTYRNDSASDVTLMISHTLRAIGVDAASALTMASQLTVPAHGSATLDVTLNPAGLAEGLYSGAVVATSGDVQLRTPVGFRRTPFTYPVQVNLKSTGELETGAWVQAFNLDQPGTPLIDVWMPSSGDSHTATITLELTPGHWSINTGANRLLASRRREAVALYQPEVNVNGPVVLNLDDKDAVPIRFSTERPSRQQAGGLKYQRMTADRSDWVTEITNTGWGDDVMYVSPTKPVTIGSQYLKFESTRGKTPVELSVDSRNGRGTRFNANYWHFLGGEKTFKGTYRHLPVVDVGESIEPAEIGKLRGKLVLMTRSIGDGTRTVCELTEPDLQAAQAAGAVGVLEEPGPVCEGVPGISVMKYLPVVGIDNVEGAQLRKLLAAGPVTVNVVGTPVSPYIYHVAMTEQGSIPAQLDYRFTDRQLARINTSYHADEPTDLAKPGVEQVGSKFDRSWEFQLFLYPGMLQLPGAREELYGPIKPGQQWVRGAAVNQDLVETEELRTTLRTGWMPPETWLVAPRGIGPATVPPASTNLSHMGWCFACRYDNTLNVLPAYTSSSPFSMSPNVVTNGTITLSRDGTVIPPTQYKGTTAYELPPEAAQYKLVSDWDLSKAADASALMYKYGAKQHTEWTFTSGRVTSADMGNTECLRNWSDGTPDGPCAPQQLLYLRYKADTDANNKVRRGFSTLRITPYYEATAHPKTAAFRSVKVKVSYDDGVTWVDARGSKVAGAYDVLLFTPLKGAVTQAVTVHVDATDLNGNTVSQTIYRSYGLS
ncbi:S8 family peptidase [Kribbella monticola]|uniref:S8 family peptidase n=1 Tax=Kribbella monticola TaxID=2185285 RepID=UPI000DD3221A|nr:S8 family peptidase [Kribbella monticola]